MCIKLVSIIIPTFKGCNEIERCVKSVLQQTYKNYEIIVVDDNGRGTKEQLLTENNLRKYYGNALVHYIAHGKNINGSAARNTGLKASKGEYICFLDDDDFFYPDRLKNQVEIMESLDDNYGMSYCSFVEIFSNTQKIVTARKEGNLLFDLLLQKVRIGSSNTMFRRRVLIEVNGFDESFKRHQDWELLVRVLLKYKIAAASYIGMGKVILNRNAPSSADLIEKYRLYFLERIDTYIKTLPVYQYERIYSHHYIEIAKAFFKENNISKYHYYSMRSKRPARCLYKSLRCRFGEQIRRIIKGK
jgi:glycosyltransferase involved in cell wall biosynthesis